MVRITIHDDDTGKEDVIEFPPLNKDFPLRGPIEIVESRLYNSFPAGLVSAPSTRPFASGGQILIDTNGNEYSRNVYFSWQPEGHHDKPPHLNVYLISKDKEMGRHKETKLTECHDIYPDKLPKTVQLVIHEGGEIIQQPLVFLPKQEDREYIQKQEEFLKKLREGKMTKEMEEEWRIAFNKYAESLQQRRKNK